MKTQFTTEEEMIEARTLALINWLDKQDSEIDLSYYFDDDIETFSDLRDKIEDNRGFDVEIIYYSNAIEYLRDNDPSFRQSLEIASDMGYEPRSLSSEILASLLASQVERDKFEKLEDEFEELFESFEVTEEE